MDIGDRIARAVGAIERTDGYVSAGTLDLGVASMLVANSAGLVAYCRSTNGSMQLSARTSDNTGSGWAGKAIYDFNDLDSAAIADRATPRTRTGPSAPSMEWGFRSTAPTGSGMASSER